MVLTQKPDPGPASEEQGQSCGTQAALGRVLTDRGLGEAGGRVETAQKRAVGDRGTPCRGLSWARVLAPGAQSLPKAGGIKHHSQKAEHSAGFNCGCSGGSDGPQCLRKRLWGPSPPPLKSGVQMRDPHPPHAQAGGRGRSPRALPTPLPPAARRAYADLSRGDPAAGGPLLDGGRS